MKTLLQLAGIISAAAALLLLPRLLWQTAAANATERFWRSQATLWITALPVLGLSLVLFNARAREFLRLHRLAGTAEPSALFGIRANEDWRRVGWQLGLVIAVVTAIVMFAPLPLSSLNFSAALPLLPLVLLFSLSNSLGEELIFRHAVVSALEDTRWAVRSPLVSAAIFGSVHYFGAPGGVLGVLMAGALGYMLTKSIRETRGLFWAWSIHFILDVIIIAAIFLQEAGK
jgi:membrane protease YdiL (CAAX protease family)